MHNLGPNLPHLSRTANQGTYQPDAAKFYLLSSPLSPPRPPPRFLHAKDSRVRDAYFHRSLARFHHDFIPYGFGVEQKAKVSLSVFFKLQSCCARMCGFLTPSANVLRGA